MRRSDAEHGQHHSTLSRLVRASHHPLQELGREPTAEELAERLAKPLDQVRKLLAIAGLPIELEIVSAP